MVRIVEFLKLRKGIFLPCSISEVLAKVLHLEAAASQVPRKGLLQLLAEAVAAEVDAAGKRHH